MVEPEMQREAGFPALPLCTFDVLPDQGQLVEEQGCGLISSLVQRSVLGTLQISPQQRAPNFRFALQPVVLAGIMEWEPEQVLTQTRLAVHGILMLCPGATFWQISIGLDGVL